MTDAASAVSMNASSRLVLHSQGRKHRQRRFEPLIVADATWFPAPPSCSNNALRRRLEDHGILARGSSRRGLAEEKPEAYKDIDAVIEMSHQAGLACKVARLIPLGVVKD